MMTDTLADMLTRIRNGQSAKLAQVRCLYSNLNISSLEVIMNAGYIRGYTVHELKPGVKEIKVDLKYHLDKQPVIKEINRVSSPGRKVYAKVKVLKTKKFYNGLGLYILSTPKGVMSDRQAIAVGLGGEILFNIY